MASPKGRVGIALSSLPSVAPPGRHCLYASSSPVAIRMTFTALPITSPWRLGQIDSAMLGGEQFRFRHHHDELAGRKVSIDQNDFVKTRAFDLYLIFDIGFGDDVIHRLHRS
jgi:hypothetical protein